MNDLIEKLNDLDQLELPNGAQGAVWLDDVIEVVENYLTLNGFDDENT